MNLIIKKLILQEEKRQENTINLIASENYASRDVIDAVGTVFMNKYCEGTPGKRFYGGCKIADELEELAAKSCNKLFGSDHCNVQPHSGSNANMAVYLSQLELGDTILGMSLSSGGHLTHGHRLNFSGRLFNVISYGVDRNDELINYDEAERLAHEFQPKMIIAGASAYSRVINYSRFKDIADSCGAILFADIAHIAGLIAAGVHPTPIGFADIISSTTHKTLRGPRGGFICCKKDLASGVDRQVMPGCQGGPLMNIIAGKAVAFQEALLDSFKYYQQQVVKNARIMAETFSDLGYKIVSGGTDNHLFLIDLRNLGDSDLNGLAVERLLESCGIVLNRNSVPFDDKSPMTPSGIRIGTPAITTRGFKEEECVCVANWINEIIKKRLNKKFLSKISSEIAALCERFPVYDKK